MEVLLLKCFTSRKKVRSKGGREGGRQFTEKKTTRKFSVVVGSFGGITSDDISHLDTTASLGYGQLQTCLYNRPGYLTNHQTLFGPGARRELFASERVALASEKD